MIKLTRTVRAAVVVCGITVETSRALTAASMQLKPFVRGETV
jgi:hypothetical protein